MVRQEQRTSVGSEGSQRRLGRQRRGAPPMQQQCQDSSDATASLIWLVSRGMQMCCDLHTVGGILLALKAGNILSWSWIWSFLPLFFGSASALATQFLVFCRAASLKLYRSTALNPRYKRTIQEEKNIINDDALPLLRRGIVITAASLPVTIVWISAQVRTLESLVLSSASASARRGQEAVACILVLQTFVLLAALVLKGRRLEERAASEIISVIDEENRQLLNKCCRTRPSGALSATFHALIWIFLLQFEILLALTASDSRIQPEEDYAHATSTKNAWAFALWPLWLAAFIFILSLLLVLWRFLHQRYLLNKRQLFCIFLYLFSTMNLAFTAFTTLGTPLASRRARRVWHTHCHDQSCQKIPALTAAAALAAAGLGLHLALTQHAVQLVKSRGHGTPLPLAKTREGFWAPSGAGQSFWFLLGSFERTVPERRALLCCTDPSDITTPDSSSAAILAREDNQPSSPTERLFRWH